MRSQMHLLVVVLLGLLQLTTNAQLVNPSFDDPKSEDPSDYDQAAGWERWGSWANRHEDQPEWRPRSGPGSVAYHHWQSDSSDAGWYQDVTNVLPGAFCRFGVWALWEEKCNAQHIEMRIEPLGGGEPLAVERYTADSVKPAWTYILVQGRLPSDAIGARFVIRCVHGFAGATLDAHGALKFDDASLKGIP